VLTVPETRLMLLRSTTTPAARSPAPAPTRAPRRYELLDRALERGAIPDPVLRAGSLYGAWARERRESRGGVTAQQERLRELLRRMSSGPIAEVPEKANEQHYELPAEFLGLILGPRRKYSGCLWEQGSATLGQAEEAMLALSCRRAQVADGMRILDLGCGWGSLSLWLAERYPRARITGVSNSRGQREWIEAERDRRGLPNLEVITADVNDFHPRARFDRVMSIEMFEHMRNWHELLRRVATWLRDDGKAFVHVFSHRTLPYLFQGTWAAERFFTAGLMPSHELLPHFQADLTLADSWIVPGTDYARTLQAWLARLDANKDQALELLRAHGRSEREARRLVGSWRLFLISTEVIWRYRRGNRWLVSHYLLEPRRRV
jgi:cyclopropane-fatty-acyl-phospholipid synthase